MNADRRVRREAAYRLMSEAPHAEFMAGEERAWRAASRVADLALVGGLLAIVGVAGWVNGWW